MKKSMTLENLYVLYDSLNHFMTLTGKAGYAVAKTARNIVPDVEIFTQKKDLLIGKYTDGGNSIKPGDPHWEEFQQEYTELCGTKVEADLYTLPEDTNTEEFICETARRIDYDIVFSYLISQEEPKQEKKSRDKFKPKNNNRR